MALEVFYSYSHKDEPLRDKLEKQLSLLRRTGLIVNWHDRRIGAGQEWRAQIDAHVRTAHIILLLISADFIESDYCYDVEMRLALERQAKHEAVVIPVILRPVDWSYAPFADLQALPRDGRPITKWADEDEAFADVARSIREVVARFEPSAPVARPDPGLLVDRLVPKPRVVDAAIPSHVVKDLGTRLLVLIRLPDSPGLRGVLQMEEDEARPEDVRSRPFNITFPLGPTGKPDPLKVTVKLTSPDFSPPEQAKNIFVPPDADSDVCPFMLTPKQIGRLTVLVELHWQDAIRGHRSLATKCVAEATDVPIQPEMNIVQMHVPVGIDALSQRSPSLPTPAEPGCAKRLEAPTSKLKRDISSGEQDELPINGVPEQVKTGPIGKIEPTLTKLKREHGSGEQDEQASQRNEKTPYKRSRDLSSTVYKYIGHSRSRLFAVTIIVGTAVALFSRWVVPAIINLLK